MFEEVGSTIRWDATDIKMAIKRYFYKLERGDKDEANLELVFMQSIHREWSFNPLMRRCGPEAMAIIDVFLNWLNTPSLEAKTIESFTIRRLLR